MATLIIFDSLIEIMKKYILELLNVCAIHKKIHEQSYNKKKNIIAQYSDKEKAIILKFLSDIDSMINDTVLEITELY